MPLVPTRSPFRPVDLCLFRGRSGSIRRPASGLPTDVAAQARQILENVKAILGDCGLTLHDVAKTTIFLTDMKDFPTVNDVYGGFFEDEPPARSTVEVAALPGGFLVEIEVIAARSY